MVCSQCGAQAKGRFCASCGASLRSIQCRGCSRSIPAGTRFCTHCGTAAAGGTEERAGKGASGAGGAVGAGAGAASGVAAGAAMGGRAASRVRDTGGWLVSAGLLGALALVVLFSEFSARSSSGGLPPARTTGVAATGGATGGAAPTGAAAVDLASMTPREAADALFNRVMGALAGGDTTQAQTFLPMAIEAHRLAEPLDADGLFHLSLLREAAGDHEGALAAALAGLEGNPNHLLNLAAAADASRELGDLEGARTRYRAMLDAWAAETAAARPEYQHHADFLPLLRAEAEAFLGASR